MRTLTVNWYPSRIAFAMMLLTLAACEGTGGTVRGSSADGASWVVPLQQVRKALAEKNIGAAEQAWYEAYLAAFGSRRWEGMVEVGDAALRLGEVSRLRSASQAKARQAYLIAFFRARDQKSIDGMLRVTESFAALGDAEVVNQGLRVAERLANLGGEAEARERVRAYAEWLAATSRLATERP